MSVSRNKSPLTELESEHQKNLQLYKRSQVAKLLGIGISHLDKIPLEKLKKVRIGRSVRYTWDAISEYIKNQGEQTDGR